ncbi:MAG: hypothetical protein N0C88_11220 [Candidatus Thiodiazotropha lotti]|uniref:Uncharacterized protein n=1 Tax=Candidatus Thiodiazotropha lotti TaxID=2792787 RepID=A0A9E4K4B4_9GAMM|nr:hypothetical protein [Candidatus Thiodiazotropha lotti]MCW4203875.1 hypothetical protein [Candidatus Thiodiazotropha lotti]
MSLSRPWGAIGSMPAPELFGYIYHYGLLEFTLPCEISNITAYYHIPGLTSLVAGVCRQAGSGFLRATRPIPILSKLAVLLLVMLVGVVAVDSFKRVFL